MNETESHARGSQLTSKIVAGAWFLAALLCDRAFAQNDPMGEEVTVVTAKNGPRCRRRRSVFRQRPMPRRTWGIPPISWDWARSSGPYMTDQARRKRVPIPTWISGDCGMTACLCRACAVSA